MDTWTDKKFSQVANSQLKVKQFSIHTWKRLFCHQLSLSLHDWLLMALWKFIVPPIKNVPKKFEILSAPSYKTRKKFLAPQYFGKWYNDRLPEVVRAGDQKWEMVEITIGVFFFVWDSCSLLFIYTENFQVAPKKNHPHPKCQFPTKTPSWPKFLLYKPGKWLNPPPPSPRVYANYEISLERSMYIFNCNKTVAAIILTHL